MFQAQAFLNISVSRYEALEIAEKLVILGGTAALSNVTLGTVCVVYRRIARLRGGR